MIRVAEVTVMDAQVRDVIEAALADHIEFLDGQAEIQASCGNERDAAVTMRQWARAVAVLRLVRREGQ